MAGLSTSVSIQDQMTAPLMRIINSMNATISSFERMQKASDASFDNSSFDSARAEIDQTTVAVEELNAAIVETASVQIDNPYSEITEEVNRANEGIINNRSSQEDFNNEIQKGENNASNLTKKIMGAVAAYASIQALKNVINLSDELTQTTSRLNLMNDGLQTTKDLQNMMYLSAQRAKGSYQATADAVSKLGLNAGDAFESTAEIVAFSEQLNKQFKIAGTETTAMKGAMTQMVQALGSGVLRGDELNSIFEAAPTIIQTIADYMEVPIGSIKEMASEGQLTADIVKNAMLSAAEETNAKFETIPRTFSDIGTSIKNTALMAFQPILEKLNEIANSEEFNSMVNSLINGISFIGQTILIIYDLIEPVLLGIFNWFGRIGEKASTIATYITENWSKVAPVVAIIATILGVLAFAYIAVQAAQLAATAAQWLLNTALFGCPIAWIIILIIALVVIIFAVVDAINKLTGSSISAIGVICGALAVAGAFIGNLFIAVINFVIDIFVILWNYIAAFANFFGNVFDDPIASIARLFFDLVDTILGLLESVASVIDTLFGSNLSGAVGGWRDDLSGWVDKTFGQGEEIMAKVSGEEWKLDRFEYDKAWDAGYNFGEGIDEKISEFDPTSLFDNNIPGPDDYTMDWGDYGNSGYESVPESSAGTAANTADIKDTLDITSEDLKYLRDIAEMETVNRFTTAEIKVEMTNNNKVENNMDLDGIVDYLTTGVNEALKQAAEGVHA